MGWEDLLIVKAITRIKEAMESIVEEFDNPLLKGLAIIFLILVSIAAVSAFVYYLIIVPIKKGELPNILGIIIGIWLFLELANLIGGGHKVKG